MKLFNLLIGLLFPFLLLSQLTADSTIQNPNYDPALAEKLGANDYGMKKYTLVILKSGTNQSTDKDFINRCFTDHMTNIKKLASEKKLVVAGPLGKNENSYRGIFILNTEDFEEAKQWLKADTAIQEGLLEPDFYIWNGSAALPEYLDASDKVWKKGF